MLLRYCLGLMPKWARIYCPKNERLGKSSSAEMSLMDVAVCFMRYSMSFMTCSSMICEGVLPVMSLHTEARYLGVMQSCSA